MKRGIFILLNLTKDVIFPLHTIDDLNNTIENAEGVLKKLR